MKDFTEQEPARPEAMIVDDDLAVRNSLKFTLEIEGLQVRTYSSGVELLSGAVFPARGCIIVDYRLPGMTGLDLLAELRKRGINLPAILMTTNPNTLLRTRAAAAGVTLIEKPLLTEALYQSVRAMLNLPATAEATTEVP